MRMARKPSEAADDPAGVSPRGLATSSDQPPAATEPPPDAPVVDEQRPSPPEDVASTPAPQPLRAIRPRRRLGPALRCDSRAAVKPHHRHAKSADVRAARNQPGRSRPAQRPARRRRRRRPSLATPSRLGRSGCSDASARRPRPCPPTRRTVEPSAERVLAAAAPPTVAPTAAEPAEPPAQPGPTAASPAAVSPTPASPTPASPTEADPTAAPPDARPGLLRRALSRVRRRARDT